MCKPLDIQTKNYLNYIKLCTIKTCIIQLTCKMMVFWSNHTYSDNSNIWYDWLRHVLTHLKPLNKGNENWAKKPQAERIKNIIPELLYWFTWTLGLIFSWRCPTKTQHWSHVARQLTKSNVEIHWEKHLLCPFMIFMMSFLQKGKGDGLESIRANQTRLK